MHHIMSGAEQQHSAVQDETRDYEAPGMVLRIFHDCNCVHIKPYFAWNTSTIAYQTTRDAMHSLTSTSLQGFKSTSLSCQKKLRENNETETF